MSRVGDRASGEDHPEPIEDVFDGQVEHPLTLEIEAMRALVRRQRRKSSRPVVNWR